MARRHARRPARRPARRSPPDLRLVEGGEIRTLRREGFRKAAEILRGYDAGKSGRRTAGWQSGGGSANAEIAPSLTTLRNRSRELVRNNPLAARALAILAAKKIGTGIQARPDKGAKAAWDEFCETCDFEGAHDLYGLQALVARTADESGECLVRRVRTREGRVPLKLQVLEPDYLDSTKYGTLENGNYAIAGVEVDRLGRKAAYWLHDQHPGEALILPRRRESVRVPAEEIIHFYEKRRPGQLRGVPRFAAAMLRLRDYDDWREAIIVKKKIEACFVAFVHGGDASQPLAHQTTETKSDGTRERTETLAPGVIEYLKNGEEVTFGTPSSAVDGGFSSDELHAIAVGCGVTYEQLTGDLKGVNYSSIRSGMGDFRDLVDVWRWLDFIPMAMRPVKDWFLDAAWTAGSIRTPRYSFLWTPPAWPYVNPVDDIKAQKEEIKGGLQSLSEKIRQMGYDPDEVFAEIAEERKKLKAAGVVVDTDAATPAKPAAAGEEKKPGDEEKPGDNPPKEEGQA